MHFFTGCCQEKHSPSNGDLYQCRGSHLGTKTSQVCVANLCNSQLLRAIRALPRAYLITNLICPELLEVTQCQ
jgi:hypothetical protein